MIRTRETAWLGFRGRDRTAQDARRGGGPTPHRDTRCHGGRARRALRGRCRGGRPCRRRAIRLRGPLRIRRHCDGVRNLPAARTALSNRKPRIARRRQRSRPDPAGREAGAHRRLHPARGEVAEIARGSSVRSGVGVPIVVSGRIGDRSSRGARNGSPGTSKLASRTSRSCSQRRSRTRNHPKRLRWSSRSRRPSAVSRHLSPRTRAPRSCSVPSPRRLRAFSPYPTSRSTDSIRTVAPRRSSRATASHTPTGP